MTTKTQSLPSVVVLSDYLEARVEVNMAQREKRLPNVRLADVVELAEKLGEDMAVSLDALIVLRMRHAAGKDPHPTTSELLDDINEVLGVEDVNAITGLIDTILQAHQTPAGELRHVTLPAEVNAVQTRSAPLSYQGTWKPDGDYRPGELATRDGVLWHCNEPTRDKPGTSKAWTMMHKNLTKAER